MDASWESPYENIGVRWSVFSKEGTLKLCGSSRMEYTNSPLVAEEMSILSAIPQLQTYMLCLITM